MFRNEYSKIVHPPLPSKTTDRSISLAIHLKNEGYFCFVSRLRSTKEGQSVLKARLWFCFNFKRARAKARKCVRGRIGAREFSRPLKHIGTSFFEVICFFFFSFLSFLLLLFFIIIIITLSCAAFKYSYRIFDGMETRKNRSSFVFTRREYFEFSNFWEITSFHWNDGFFFSLQTCEGLNLILSYFIYRASYRSNTIFKMAKKKKRKEIKIRIKRSHPPFPEIVVVSLWNLSPSRRKFVEQWRSLWSGDKVSAKSKSGPSLFVAWNRQVPDRSLERPRKLQRTATPLQPCPLPFPSILIHPLFPVIMAFLLGHSQSGAVAPSVKRYQE